MSTKRPLQIAVILLTLVCVQRGSAQWVEAVLPAPFNDGYYLDVFFLPSNPQYGWSCSIQGYIIRTTDGGASWQGSSIPNAFLEYVQFLNPLVGYTSGSAGVYRSTDGGRSWTDVTPFDPNSEKGWGSYWLNEFEGVYFVGGCTSGIQAFYRTTDGGTTWSVSYGTEPLSGLSDGIIYESGEGYAVSSGVIWRTFDRGASWRVFSRTGSNVWSEELAINGRSMLVPTSGNDCDGQTRGIGSLRYSRDGGRTWSETPTRANMFGSFLLDENRGWGVGDERTVMYTSDAGATWDNRNCGIRGNIDDIWFVNDTLGWAVGNGVYKSNFNAPGPFVRITPVDDVIAICPNDSVYVQVATNGGDVRWSDGVNAPGRYLSAAGRYIATVYDKFTCLSASDTVRVVMKSEFRPRIATTTREACEGDSILLSVDGPILQWKWTDGELTSQVYARKSGTYECEIRDTAGCTQKASITVTFRPLPTPNITWNRPLVLCIDEVVTLSAPAGFRDYRWSTGESGSSVTTGTAGKYSVTVVDDFGCVGTSDSVEVITLNTRNKVEILSASTGEVVIPDHEVGGQECRRVVIRNRSDFEVLQIVTPYLVGNVFISMPQAQFPIFIPPLGSAEVVLCAAAIDTGLVEDTLAVPDTCSVVKIPVRSRGYALEFSGSSRCDVSIGSVVTSAGGTYRLENPYPVPASSTLTATVTHVQGAEGSVEMLMYDASGRKVSQARNVVHGTSTSGVFEVNDLQSGPYLLVVVLAGEPLHTSVVNVLH